MTILASVKLMSAIKDPLHNEQSVPADPKKDNVLVAMALYQGADFFLAKRLNRWKKAVEKGIREWCLV